MIVKLKDGGFVIDQGNVRARNENQFFAIEIDYDTYFERTQFLRLHIQLELVVALFSLRSLYLPITSFIGFYTKDISQR